MKTICVGSGVIVVSSNKLISSIIVILTENFQKEKPSLETYLTLNSKEFNKDLLYFREVPTLTETISAEVINSRLLRELRLYFKSLQSWILSRLLHIYIDVDYY